MKKINKLEILNALNSAWLIDAANGVTLNIETSDVSITMPVWANQAAIMIDGKETRIDMECIDGVLTLGAWDIPRLNSIL